MTSKYDFNDMMVKIYYESCPEFEEVRELCLQEDNWLKYNYVKENLILEQHTGYGVLYQASTGKPIVMAGVFNDSRYPKNVAKMINRLYTFPDFRMGFRDMTDGFRTTCRLIDELLKVNSYDCYLITMQNRPARPNKKWWDVWVHHMALASNNMWTLGTGYIQTCPWNVQKCWQNYVYYDAVPNSFANWNPKLIDHNEWLTLEEGK